MHYHLAHYWDRGLRQRADEEATRRLSARKAAERATGRATGVAPGEVPRGLRCVLKRSPAVWAWACAIEEQVRRVATAVVNGGGGDWEEVCVDEPDDQLEMEDDELVVLVDSRRRRSELRARDLRPSDAGAGAGPVPLGVVGVVFENLGEGEGASFK